MLDLTGVPSSVPKRSRPDVHGFVDSPALKSIGALLSPPTQPILEVVFTKDICLIDILIRSLHVLVGYIDQSLRINIGETMPPALLTPMQQYQETCSMAY